VHDVFVLQVSGRKQWTVHRPVVDNPLDNHPFDGFKTQIAERVTEAALIDTILEPGDALYLPRGTIHSAQALGETSIHLTVGVHPLTRYQLARFLLDAVQDDPELRASLPMGADLADPDVLAPHLAATVTALQTALEHVPGSRIAEKLRTNLMQRTRPEAIGPLAQLAAADALASDTPLRCRGALRLRLVPDNADGGDERFKLVLLDRTIDLPASTADAVTVAIDGRAFTPADLPGLDPADQLTLSRRLLREGVLVPA
jgi:lysine-specific demethylase/histidyl-hydroxylase NO66